MSCPNPCTTPPKSTKRRNVVRWSLSSKMALPRRSRYDPAPPISPIGLWWSLGVEPGARDYGPVQTLGNSERRRQGGDFHRGIGASRVPSRNTQRAPWSPGTLLVIIRVTNLRREFTVGIETIHALDGVDLSIERGEMVAIMGSSDLEKARS